MEQEQEYQYSFADSGDRVKWLALEHGYSIDRIAKVLKMSKVQVIRRALREKKVNTVRKPKPIRE